MMLLVGITLLATIAAPAAAQVPERRDTLPPRPERDTLVAAGDTIVARPVDSVPRPPISPRRAFLYSLAIPGLGQAKLDRAYSGAFFMAIEALALAMSRKSGRALAAARMHRDSITVAWQAPAGDPTGTPQPVRELTLIGQRIESRRTQVEDWIAILIFNHIFAGADAFVAAQLWDLPEVIASKDAIGTRIAVRVRW